MRRHYAQPGQEERCEHCGRLVELSLVGHRIDGAEVWRWAAMRKTRLAPIPTECPKRPRHYHEPEGYTAGGAPTNTQSTGQENAQVGDGD